jgi:hypothetical protein
VRCRGFSTSRCANFGSAGASQRPRLAATKSAKLQVHLRRGPAQERRRAARGRTRDVARPRAAPQSRRHPAPTRRRRGTARSIRVGAGSNRTSGRDGHGEAGEGARVEASQGGDHLQETGDRGRVVVQPDSPGYHVGFLPWCLRNTIVWKGGQVAPRS